MADARPQGRHAGLTRDRVVRTALRVVDREGASSLSMRRLARELDVEAPTLYHHVASKEALEDALLEHVLDQSLPGPGDSGPWRAVITAYAEGLHRGLAAHPGTVALFASRPGLTTKNLDQLERLLQVLTTAGFSVGVALRIVHAVAAAVLGQHLTSSAPHGGTPPPLDGVPRTAELPLVRAALADGALDPDARLSFTLEALLDGFERLRSADR